MRWTQLLSADARDLLCDNNQILTAFIDFSHTYCSPIMVNLIEYPPMYGRIDGLRKHDIVVGEIVVRGRVQLLWLCPEQDPFILWEFLGCSAREAYGQYVTKKNTHADGKKSIARLVI